MTTELIMPQISAIAIVFFWSWSQFLKVLSTFKTYTRNS